MEADPRELDVERLLTHAAWLRALARSLVADGALADDLAQETWLAAVRRPPGADDPRGWLARTVRNALRKEVRDRSRRTAREQATEARDGADSAELVQRVEAQRMLAGLVLALEEPYRSTLVRRYYGGLSAAEIARRDGVPAGTVRWRLHTALEELRARLGARHGTREAWSTVLAPLAPFALRTTAGRSGAAATAGIAGGLVMGIKAVLACAAVAAVAGGLYLGFRGKELRPGGGLETARVAEEAKLAAPEARGAAETERGTLIVTGVEGERVPLVAHAATQELPVVRVGAWRPDGSPVAGVTISLSPFERDEPVLSTAVTDAEGRARLTAPPELGGRGRIAWSGTDVLRRSEDFPELSKELWLRCGWTAALTGVVRDAETGEPLEGVELSLLGEPGVLTRPDGRYRLGKLPVDESRDLQVCRAGYVTQRPSFLLNERGDAVLDLALERGVPLELRVYDRTTELPLAGATLSQDERIRVFATTDAEGKATLRVVPDTQLALLVQVPGYCSLQWDWHTPVTLAPTEIRLPLLREVSVEGRVIDGNGLPLPETAVYAQCDVEGRRFLSLAELRAFGPGDAGLYECASEVMSDADGGYKVQAVPCGHGITLHASHSGFADRSLPLGEALGPGTRVHLDVQLVPGGTIRGRVLENGVRWAGVEVVWMDAGGDWGGSASTDEEGRYELLGVAPGDVRVVVQGAGRMVFDEAHVTVEGEQVVVQDFARAVAPLLGEISGRVTLAGAALAGQSVVASAASPGEPGGRSFYADTDAEGFYRLAVPEGGVFKVSAHRRPTLRTREAVPAGATDVDFDFPALGTLRLRLVDAASGDPVQLLSGGAIFVLWRPSGAERFETELLPFDLAGRQDLSVAAGRVDVLVQLPEEGYSPRLIEGARVPPDGASEVVDVVLERGCKARLLFVGEGVAPEDLRDHLLFLLEQADLGRIEGPFAEHDGRSNNRINGICMRLESPTLLSQLLAVSRDGGALVPGLRPGRYHLRVYPDDFAFEPSAFDLPGATEGPLRISWRRR